MPGGPIGRPADPADLRRAPRGDMAQVFTAHIVDGDDDQVDPLPLHNASQLVPASQDRQAVNPLAPFPWVVVCETHHVIYFPRLIGKEAEREVLPSISGA